jgi:hypothetical protein
LIFDHLHAFSNLKIGISVEEISHYGASLEKKVKHFVEEISYFASYSKKTEIEKKEKQKRSTIKKLLKSLPNLYRGEI